MFIDTHTHLYLNDFDHDRNQVISACLNNGIKKLFLPNIDSSSVIPLLDLVKEYPNICHPMMGLHPCSVKNDFEKALEFIKPIFNKEKIIGVGEIGIDLYWDKSTLPQQKEAFKEQINWAKEMKLPIVIHARNSYDEIFDVIDTLNDKSLSGVFHCFTGNIEQAQHIINYGGFKFGIGGVVTYKNSGLDKTLSNIDLSHIVLETDSPYLSPAPNRGKRNESTYLTYIADKLSDIYGCSYDIIAEQTTQNTLEIFNLEI